MSSSDFTQRRRQEHQVQAAAHAEEEQHGSHGHGKEEREETADQMLDWLLEEMDTPGQEHGEKITLLRVIPTMTLRKCSYWHIFWHSI